MIAPRRFRLVVLLLAIGYSIEVAATASYSSFGFGSLLRRRSEGGQRELETA